MIEAIVGTFHSFGLKIAAGVIFGGLAIIAAIDLGLEVKDKRPLGYWVTRWSRRYPFYPFLLAGFYGALLAHFFWSTRVN